MPKLTLCQAAEKFPVGARARDRLGMAFTVRAASDYLDRRGTENVGSAFKSDGYIYVATQREGDTYIGNQDANDLTLIPARDERLLAAAAKFPVGARVTTPNGAIRTVLDAKASGHLSSIYSLAADIEGSAFLIDGRVYVVTNRPSGSGTTDRFPESLTIVPARDEKLVEMDAAWPVGTRVQLRSGSTGVVTDASTYNRRGGIAEFVGGAFRTGRGFRYVYVVRDGGAVSGGENPSTLSREAPKLYTKADLDNARTAGFSDGRTSGLAEARRRAAEFVRDLG